jgi:hypothetical protein
MGYGINYLLGDKSNKNVKAIKYNNWCHDGI